MRSPKKRKIPYTTEEDDTEERHHHPSLYFLGASLLGHTPAVQYSRLYGERV
jgi:hypothetical protein